MKTALIAVLLGGTSLLFGQTPVDSAAVQEVDSLIQVSRALTAKGDFDKALDLNATAEQIALEKLGRESAAYGSCCHNRGRVNAIQANYPEAEKWFIEAVAIQEKTFGKNHPDYAYSLTNLGNLYYHTGNYEKAERLHLEAKTIREKTTGKDHPGYASVLTNLANVYHTVGNFEKAELLFLETKIIRERTIGKEHPDYAISLNNLGNLYYHIGNFEKAEQHHLEAKAIRERTIGKEHPFYATSLNNLGILYKVMGNHEKAEPLYLEAKAISEKKLGKDHPDYASCLNSLATLYGAMRNYEKAEQIHLEAIAIREKTPGKEHPEYAQSLNNLATLYQDMGNYEKAELFFLEAKAIREKTIGREHPDYGWNLENLAILYSNIGNYEKAEPLYLEAKAIHEKTLGKQHPDYAKGLYNLAVSKETQKRFYESEPPLDEYFSLTKAELTRSTAFLSERELASFTATFKGQGDNLSSFLLTRRAKNEREGILPALNYDQSLFQKGFLLSAANRLNGLAKSSPEAEETNSRLKGYRRRLSGQYANPIAGRDSILVADLEEKANAAEKELARTVDGYAEAVRQVSWKDVQSALKKSEAAIEFVSFRVNFPKKTDSTMYAALVLLPGSEQPVFVPLFEEKQLAALFKNTSEKAKSALYASRGAKPVRPQNLSDLYEVVWKPLDSLLAGVKKIWFAPSGMLHRLNFSAMPVPGGKALSDRYELVELGSTRQLVVPSTHRPAADDAVLFGGLKYDAADGTAVLPKDTLPDDAPPIGFQPEMAARGLANRGGKWDYLPGTESEVAAIAETLNKKNFSVKTFRKEEGTEEAFKQIGKNTASPRILHIATHGFFFPDPSGMRNADHGMRNEQEPVFKISDHPMLRSGLIMAGGNAAWQGAKTLEGKEDGILTAYEISQMNLSNTELVVLSACETGLGDIQGNEGVYGLQRAFKIAGAKYLIMSLWQVPDKQTAMLMTSFYKKWLVEKQPIPEAFRAAQQGLREAGFDPYQWAGFVLIE